MFEKLKEFKISVEEEGISRRSIDMFEKTIGEPIISSQININHFTEKNTAIGLEAFRHLFNIYNSQNDNGDFEITRYKNNKTLLAELLQTLNAVVRNLEDFCKVSPESIAYLNNPSNTTIFNNDNTGLTDLLDLQYSEFLNSPYYDKIIANLIAATGGPNQIAAGLSRDKAMDDRQLASDFCPIFDFLEQLDLSTMSHAEQSIIAIVEAYNKALTLVHPLTVRDMLVILQKMPEYLKKAKLLYGYVQTVNPTLCTLQEGPVPNVISVLTNEWSTYPLIFRILADACSCRRKE